MEKGQSKSVSKIVPLTVFIAARNSTSQWLLLGLPERRGP